jgi:hypothetical protein
VKHSRNQKILTGLKGDHCLKEKDPQNEDQVLQQVLQQERLL